MFKSPSTNSDWEGLILLGVNIIPRSTARPSVASPDPEKVISPTSVDGATQSNTQLPDGFLESC